MFGELTKTYLALGTGGFALIILAWVVIYTVRKIHPSLEAIKENNAAHQEVIRNNTEAIKEVSKSNENVASALSLLKASTDNTYKILEKHDDRVAQMENRQIQMNETIKNSQRKGN